MRTVRTTNDHVNSKRNFVVLFAIPLSPFRLSPLERQQVTQHLSRSSTTFVIAIADVVVATVAAAVVAAVAIGVFAVLVSRHVHSTPGGSERRRGDSCGICTARTAKGAFQFRAIEP